MRQHMSPRGYQLHVATDDTGMSDLVPNLVRLAPNGTNLVLFCQLQFLGEKKKKDNFLKKCQVFGNFFTFKWMAIFWHHSESDWAQMKQILDFLSRRAKMNCKVILKSSKFVSFGIQREAVCGQKQSGQIWAQSGSD